MPRKVAIVTGSNKGIGFAVVEALCAKFDGDVILCSRDLKRGEEAVNQLEAKGLHPILHQLDVEDVNSICRLRDFIRDNYDGLDILVNNAAVVYVDEMVKPLYEIASETIRINYMGVANVCDQLLPLLRPTSRVVNVSSITGMINWITSKGIRDKLQSEELTRSELDDLVKQYLLDVRDDSYSDKGWPIGIMSATKASKIFMTALTWIYWREITKKQTTHDIVINVAHPGFVRTDMSGGRGTVDPEEGALPILKGCFVPEMGNPRGSFIWNDGSIVPWDMDREELENIIAANLHDMS